MSVPCSSLNDIRNQMSISRFIRGNSLLFLLLLPLNFAAVPPVLEILQYLHINHPQTLYHQYLVSTVHSNVLDGRHFDSVLLKDVDLELLRDVLKAGHVREIEKHYAYVGRVERTVKIECDSWLYYNDQPYCSVDDFWTANVVSGATTTLLNRQDVIIDQKLTFHSLGDKDESSKLSAILFFNPLDPKAKTFVDSLQPLWSQPGLFRTAIIYKPSHYVSSIRQTDKNTTSNSFWGFLKSKYFHFLAGQIIVENWLIAIARFHRRRPTTFIRFIAFLPIILLHAQSLHSLIQIFRQPMLSNDVIPAFFSFFQTITLSHTANVFFNCLEYGRPLIETQESSNLLWFAISLFSNGQSRDMLLIAIIQQIQQLGLAVLGLHKDGQKGRLIITTITGLLANFHFGFTYLHSMGLARVTENSTLWHDIGTDFPALFFVSRFPEFCLLSIVSIIFFLHTITCLLTGISPQTRRLFRVQILPQSDFSLVLFKLGMNCLETGQSSGLWNEMDPFVLSPRPVVSARRLPGFANNQGGNDLQFMAQELKGRKRRGILAMYTPLLNIYKSMIRRLLFLRVYREQRHREARAEYEAASLEGVDVVETEESGNISDLQDAIIWEDFKRKMVISPEDLEDAEDADDGEWKETEEEEDDENQYSEEGNSEGFDGDDDQSSQEGDSQQSTLSEGNVYKELWEITQDLKEIENSPSPVSPQSSDFLSHFLEPLRTSPSFLFLDTVLSIPRTRSQFRHLLSTSLRQSPTFPRIATASSPAAPNPDHFNRECVVCGTNARSIVLRPCNCLCLCDECREELAVRRYQDCPTCRRKVFGYCKIYEP